MANKKTKISSWGTIRTFLKDGTWSQAIMGVVDRSFDHPLELEERASATLAGGIMMQGYQCGMLWGAALAAGAQAYQLYGPGPQAHAAAIVASQRLVDTFRARAKNEINCTEITEMNFHADNPLLPILKFLFKGGPIGCFKMAAGYAPDAYKDIQSAYAENQIEAPGAPLSCASTLAQKAGLCDLHVAMAAGLAGGIGLSGGACGVLGAAAWIVSVDERGDAPGGELQNPAVARVIEAFLESSDYQFECSEIVGRAFENVADHAAYLQEGGCTAIIEALAAHILAEKTAVE